MPPLNTDKFIKGARKLTTNLDASGISSAVIDNFGFTSGAGFPTDTAVVVTVDRVDVNGTKTPSKEESILAVMAGSGVVSAIRGFEGTAQAHSPGAVVEVRLLAGQWNRLIDGILVEHYQSGAHHFESAPTFKHLATPSNPAAGYLKVYAKSDGKIYKLSNAGVEAELGTSFASLNPPQGFLINGKIVHSVASNALTVAIKTLAGADPSSSDPVYVRIGDTIRSITAALSVTTASGVNIMNLSSGEMFTRDTDIFAYLGYNATDGVVLGIARIPFATKYSDFNTTPAHEKYAKISTITNATASDVYENVGRCNAQQDGAGNWSITSGVPVINRPIFESRELLYAPQWTGFSANPTANGKYKLIDDRCFVDTEVTGNGTSNSTGMTMSFPFAFKSSRDGIGINARSFNSGNRESTVPRLDATAGSNVGNFYRALDGTLWTASGAKAVAVRHDYQV